MIYIYIYISVYVLIRLKKQCIHMLFTFMKSKYITSLIPQDQLISP